MMICYVIVIVMVLMIVMNMKRKNGDLLNMSVHEKTLIDAKITEVCVISLQRIPMRSSVVQYHYY